MLVKWLFSLTPGSSPGGRGKLSHFLISFNLYGSLAYGLNSSIFGETPGEPIAMLRVFENKAFS
jgi:hypothetical protein